MVRPMQAFRVIRETYGNSFRFSGRSSRREFLTFTLFRAITGLLFFGSLLLAEIEKGRWIAAPLSFVVLGLLLVNLTSFFSSIALTFRRLRDAGRSIWWQAGTLGAWLVLLIVKLFPPSPTWSHRDLVFLGVGILIALIIVMAGRLAVFLQCCRKTARGSGEGGNQARAECPFRRDRRGTI